MVFEINRPLPSPAPHPHSMHPATVHRKPRASGCPTARYLHRKDLEGVSLTMGKAAKYLELGVATAAKGGGAVFDRLNRISPNASFTPKWSDKPLLKSYQKE